jgi:predicted SnoaL-like aldol condensation-catalyzing enzyme
MPTDSPDSQVAIARQFLTMVCDGRVQQAYDDFVGAGFRHHNPWFRGDAASLRDAMAQNAAQFPGKRIEIHKVLEDGDQVAVLSRVQHTPEGPAHALVHFFRFADGRIAELWDVAQPIPAEVVNENGMF